MGGWHAAGAQSEAATAGCQAPSFAAAPRNCSPDRPKKRVTSPLLPSLQPECSDRMPICRAGRRAGETAGEKPQRSTHHTSAAAARRDQGTPEAAGSECAHLWQHVVHEGEDALLHLARVLGAQYDLRAWGGGRVKLGGGSVKLSGGPAGAAGSKQSRPRRHPAGGARGHRGRAMLRLPAAYAPGQQPLESIHTNKQQRAGLAPAATPHASLRRPHHLLVLERHVDGGGGGHVAGVAVGGEGCRCWGVQVGSVG